MLPVLRLSLFAFLLLVFTAVSPSITAAPATFEQVRASVVKLYNHAEGGGQCSAVAVRPGQYVTARHCVNTSDEEMVLWASPMLKGTAVLRLIDEENDLALVESEVLKGGVTLGAKPHVGDHLVAIGYPYDIPVLSFAECTFLGNGVPFEGFQEKTLVNCQLIPGMSGGPIVNDAGQLVSINQMGTKAALAGGAPYAALRDLLKR